MSLKPLRVIVSESTDFLTKDQVKEYIENIPKLKIYSGLVYARKPLPSRYFQLYTKILYDAALRSGEGRSIKVEDLDLQYARIKLPRTKTGWDWCSCSKHAKRVLLSCDPGCRKCSGIGKLRRPQFGTTSEGIAKEIHQFIQEEKIPQNHFIFTSPSNPKHEISREWIRKYMKEVGSLCSFDIFSERKVRVIKGFYTHLMRRSRAIQMDIDGAPLGVISRKLRHMNIQTTSTYIKSSIGDLQTWEKDQGNWI